MTNEGWIEKIAIDLCSELEWPEWYAQSETAREKYRVAARKTVATLSKPEFALPVAERLLRDQNAWRVYFLTGGDVCVDRQGSADAEDCSLIECYLSMRGAV